MKKNIPEYITPEGTRCPACKKLCKIIPLRNEFDYSGSHVTHGLSGTHYPENFGNPVSDCCHMLIEEHETTF